MYSGYSSDIAAVLQIKAIRVIRYFKGKSLPVSASSVLFTATKPFQIILGGSTLKDPVIAELGLP